MNTPSSKSNFFPVFATTSLIVIVLLVIYSLSGKPLSIENWHQEKLSEEFSADQLGKGINSFDDYLRLEERLFRELDEEIYSRTGTGPEQLLNRFSKGSMADPMSREPNWNRSFELNSGGDAGAVLLLHGMSDSPYSLRALGEQLALLDYRVLGLRIPGHGTAPSGLKYVAWRDMAAAVTLAAKHLEPSTGSGSLHIIGYSNGASLALDYALRALEDRTLPEPASLVLISASIRVHPAAALARFKNALAVLPGLGGWAWLDVMDEFDPYKYNSFATNAGAQVHAITTDVDRRIQQHAGNPNRSRELPPIMVLNSAVDATVTADAVVNSLLMRLPAGRNELVLFDINRDAVVQSTLMVSDPGPLTRRLMADKDLPFAVTIVSNEGPDSSSVVARYKAWQAKQAAVVKPIGMSWPAGVISLSHVAMPFPPDDPLYGELNPQYADSVFLGNLAIKGERGLLKLPADWLLRLRHNPFYDYMETRVVDWLDKNTDRDPASFR
jgi:alpha-beta hydrolase superfamily lysophospholipase